MTESVRVCFPGAPGRAYCGRKKPVSVAEDWRRVTCVDCQAAFRADEGAVG